MYDKGKEKFSCKQINQYDDQCIATISCRSNSKNSSKARRKIKSDSYYIMFSIFLLQSLLLLFSVNYNENFYGL